MTVVPGFLPPLLRTAFCLHAARATSRTCRRAVATIMNASVHIQTGEKQDGREGGQEGGRVVRMMVWMDTLACVGVLLCQCFGLPNKRMLAFESVLALTALPR